MPETSDPRPWREDWQRLRRLLLQPSVDDQVLESALSAARERQPLPVVWLLGKAQSGKTSIIRALTGSPSAEIGNGFRPCTRTARLYDFPAEAPVVRFLDTRGLGEVAYDPAEDIRFCEAQAHLVLGVMKATDLGQEAVFEVLRAVRGRHPRWPVLIAQTGLHEGYPPDLGHLLPYPFDRPPWPATVPKDLTRSLLAERDGLGRLPGSAAPRWVPIDLTLPEDGLEPADYGLEALWAAIDEISTLDLQARLRGDPGVRDTFASAPSPLTETATMRFGPPPQILWLTCGNLTNRRLRTLLDEVLADALTLPATGVVVVECGDLAETVADRAAKGFGHGGVPHGPTGSKADRVRGG